MRFSFRNSRHKSIRSPKSGISYLTWQHPEIQRKIVYLLFIGGGYEKVLVPSQVADHVFYVRTVFVRDHGDVLEADDPFLAKGLHDELIQHLLHGPAAFHGVLHVEYHQVPPAFPGQVPDGEHLARALRAVQMDERGVFSLIIVLMTALSPSISLLLI